MDKELLKCLIDFYSKLEGIDNKWKEISKNAGKVIEALKNQAEQLRHVTSLEVDNAELCKVEGLRERLIFKIHAGIEEEVTHVQEAVARLHNYTQELRSKRIKIEATRSKFSLEDENMSELVKGNSYRPRLNSLLEWAIDACDYYHNLYCHVSDSLKALDYKDDRSIEKLAESFLESKKPTRVNEDFDRALAFTQFLARETCR